MTIIHVHIAIEISDAFIRKIAQVIGGDGCRIRIDDLYMAPCFKYMLPVIDHAAVAKEQAIALPHLYSTRNDRKLGSIIDGFEGKLFGIIKDLYFLRAICRGPCYDLCMQVARIDEEYKENKAK